MGFGFGDMFGLCFFLLGGSLARKLLIPKSYLQAVASSMASVFLAST